MNATASTPGVQLARPFPAPAAAATAGHVRPTVVLFHSSAASSRQWHALAERLRPDFDVQAIDFHGHGLQPPWRGELALTVRDEAALALPILQAAGRAHLIGHSYGAAIALHLAMARPDLVASVAGFEPVTFALLDEHEPHGAATIEVREVAEDMRRSMAAGRPEDAAARFFDYWSSAPAWARLDPRRQQVMTALMPSVAMQFHAVYTTALPAEALARLDMPLLLLSGGRSTAAAQRIAGMLRRLLPAAQHEILPGVGHLAPLTHAELVNERLLRFVHSVALGAPSAVLA